MAARRPILRPKCKQEGCMMAGVYGGFCYSHSAEFRRHWESDFHARRDGSGRRAVPKSPDDT